MTLEEQVNYITHHLDAVLDRYSDVSGFNHPLHDMCPKSSPLKDAWGDKWHIGNVYRWCIRYETGDTRDSSATLVKYFPDKAPHYQIVYGKSREAINGIEETSDFRIILERFEETIVKNIIGERPKN